MEGDVPLLTCPRTVPPFHREDMDVRVSAEPCRQLAIPKFLAPTEIWIYSVGDESNHRPRARCHLPAPLLSFRVDTSSTCPVMRGLRRPCLARRAWRIQSPRR